MFLTILGFLVFLLPFSAVVCFGSRLRGFLTVFVVSSAFHIFVALVTQSLLIFSYPIVFFIHLVFGILALCVSFKYKKVSEQKKSINWFFLCSFTIVVLLFVSIHYYYSGIVDGVNGAQMVQRSSYTYPLFSDEWSAVSFINYSIENKSLPFTNPLNNNAPFINFLAGFHSFVSEIVLLLGFNPLTQYVWLAIANGIFICFIIYTILRLSGLSVYTASIAMMATPFITNSGNLPGILYLIPYTLSLSFLFSSISGFLLKDKLITFLSLMISLVIYPPMIVFIIPILISVVVSKQYELFKFSKNTYIFLSFFVLLLIVILFGIKDFSFDEIYKQFVSFLIRENREGGIVSFRLWDVIPIFLIPFVFFGIFDLIKRRFNIILLPLAVGVAFWIFYSFYSMIFLIEHTRIVAVTSIFLVIVSGFGIERVVRYFAKKYTYTKDPFVSVFIRIFVLVFFVVLSIFYSRFSLWHKLTLEVKNQNGHIQKYIPSPSVTRYLTNEDLKLFEGIKGKRFISPLWKGLVIGVATGNYPMDSKGSTITNSFVKYLDFMGADCRGKVSYAEKFKIDYVYSTSFSCREFELIGKSRENLFLYKFIDSALK